jgi:chemotaxis protein MotA
MSVFRRGRRTLNNGVIEIMDIATLIGIVAGLILLGFGILVGNGSILWYMDPASALITIGGSFCSMLVAYPLAKISSMLNIAKITFFPQKYDPSELILTVVSFSEKARREGLLALEDDLGDLDDEFLGKGIQLVVDGNDPELVRKILETDIEQLIARHDEGKNILDNWGTLAPSFGMIGTLIGLIIMLQNLEDRSMVGPGLAVALITTLYGAIMCYLILAPMAIKLDLRTNEEVLTKMIMLEGVLSIQSGENPRIVKDKLVSFLPPSQREAISSEVGD